MANMQASRRDLGDQFSEGARLLWKALERRKWTQADLRRQLRTDDGKPLSPGQVCRWLYGDRLPSLLIAVQLHELLGIKPAAWSQKPAQDFKPPAAVAA